VRTGWKGSVVFGVLALALGGCGSLAGGLHPDTLALGATPVVAPEPVIGGDAVAATPAPPAPEIATPRVVVAAAPVEVAPIAVEPPAVAPAAAAPTALAFLPPADAEPAAEGAEDADASQVAQRSGTPPADTPIEEYDPWEPFNDRMFTFNYNLDRYVLKPIARGYNTVVPDPVQRMIDNLFVHVRVVPRVVNSLLQAKWAGAGREVSRFAINTVFGIGGLFDMAKQEFGIEPSKEDFGQTLGVWGAGPGPYLVLPFLSPTTVRDGIGLAVDGAMDPLSYVLPFIWERLFLKAVDTVNERSLNLELFEGVEATTVDLYTAVRNAYLQRRAKQIRE
jgi:phospholipid-binding lipoprotein MlaA